MIDWKRVEELRDEIGHDDFPEIFAVFLDEVDSAIDRLKTTELDKVTPEDMHFLKGSAVTLGLTDTGQLCKMAETRLASHPCVDADVSEIIATYGSERQELLSRTEM